MNQRLIPLIHHPLHKFMGVETIHAENGKGVFTIAVNKNIINPAGVLHGGVVYTLSDLCAYAGLLSILDSNLEAVTHDLHVSVMRSVASNAQVTFESQIQKMGKRVCFIDVSVSSSKERIASARVTKSIIQPF